MLALDNHRNIQLTIDGMEIEIDLSVTKAIGNLTFTSTENEVVFILLGHLPGFLQEKIEVSVNETGTEISISGAGEKSSFETLIGSRVRLKNEFENSSFRKVFRIPDDVALDQINACFCEDKAILMIFMPKSRIGEVSGREIQEVEEQEEAQKEKESEGDTKIQIGTASSASDRNGDEGPEHMEAESNIRREKQEEPGKNTDIPENPLAETEKSAVNGEPASPAVASKAIVEEEHEEPAEPKGRQNQQSETGNNEKRESTEADRDLDQPEEHQMDHEQQKEQSETAQDMDQPEEREKEAESTEPPKSNGDLHQTEETSEMVKRIEAPVLEEHEVPQSIEADRDDEQPEEKKDPEPETVQAAETNEMEQQEDREQVPESIETPKYEEPPEMDQRTEAPIEEGEGMEQQEDREQVPESIETPKYEEPPEMDKRTEAPIEEGEEMEQHEDREQVPESIETPKYEEPPEMDQRTEAPIEEGEGMEQQEDREQVPESIETPKYEEPPEMDQRTEALIEEEDEEGEGREWNRQKASKRKTKRDPDGRLPAPSLILSAFIVSLVALVVELVRSRARR